jgi:quercetin dioxygenase-like cupin family protein
MNQKGLEMPLPQAAKQGLLAGLCFAAGIAVTMAFAKITYPPLEVLLSSSQSVLGQDLAYPTGKPVITAAIVTLMPGESTGAHLHEVPMFAMILDGEITVDYGQDRRKLFVEGDAMLEAFKTYHTGVNTGPEPVRILAVFAGSETAKNTVMQD